jgi:hypothetical protein
MALAIALPSRTRVRSSVQLFPQWPASLLAHLQPLLAVQHFGLGLDAVQPGDALDRLRCWRRLKVDPPCRLNIDPGRVAAF